MRRPEPILLLMLLAAAGCATKAPPTAEALRREALPGMVLTNAWTAGGTAGSVSNDWIASFADAQLSALVAEAVTNNLDLRAAAARVEQAAGYVELARSALRPALNLFGTGGLRAGGGGSDISGALQGIALGVSWEPDLWGRIRYGRNAAVEMHAAAQNDFAYARQSLAAATAQSWFTVAETYLHGQIAAEMTAASEDLVALSERRLRVGVGSQRDVALANAGLRTVQDLACQVALAQVQARRGLETLLGRYPAAALIGRRDLPAMPGPVPVGMPLEMLERRPDLVAAERRVAAAFNRVGEAKAARLPRIRLNASVGLLESEVLQLKDDFTNPTGGAGGTLLAPIYRGGEFQAQVEIRTLEQKEAVAQYAAMALRALTEVENGLAASQTLVEREQILRQAVADNSRALELERESYRVGRGDLRAVQQQQLAWHSARVSLLRVQSEQLSQRVRLHLALGGTFGSSTSATP